MFYSGPQEEYEDVEALTAGDLIEDGKNFVYRNIHLINQSCLCCM